LGLGLTYRQNGEPYGAWNVFASGTHMEAPCVEAGSFQNATALGGVVALGYKVNDTFTVEGSYGKLKAEQDTTLKNEDDAQVFGLMAKITVAPGVFIIPEFIYQDNMDNTIDGVSNDDEGNATVFGVFWMINFK
jgi:hypothetical protein